MRRRRITTAMYGLMVGAVSVMLMVQHVSRTSGTPLNSAADIGAVVPDPGADGGAAPLYPDYPGTAPLPALPGVPDLTVTLSGESPVLSNMDDIPSTVLQAYRRAAATVGMAEPDCHLPLSLLAAIGRVESRHARGGAVDARGTTLSPILGPRLDGGVGVAAIRDTDGGAYDRDSVWDRAVGPMQFIPSTWRRWSADGNEDGVSSPHNVFDATLAAGGYLCAAGGNVATPNGLRRAILAYNRSESYLDLVLAWMRVYAGGTSEVPDAGGAPGADEGTARQAGYQAPPPRENTSGPAPAGPPAGPAPKQPPPAPSPGPTPPAGGAPGDGLGGPLPPSPSAPALPAPWPPLAPSLEPAAAG